MSTIRRFVKGSLLLTFASVMVRLSGILVLAPLARILGAQQLGIYSLMFWIVQCATLFGLLGIDTAMHRNGSQTYETDPQATGRLLGSGSLIMTFSLTAIAISLWIWRAPLAQHWLANPSASRWLGYAAIITCVEGLSLVASTLILSLHGFRYHSFATSTGAIARLVLSPLCAWLYGLQGALFGLVCASSLQCIAAIISFWRLKKKYRINLSLQGFWSESYKILKFGIPFWMGNALVALLVLPIMGEIGRIAGVETLGQLRIAQSLSQIVGFLPGAIAPVAISLLSEAHATTGKNEEFLRLRSLHLRGNWLFCLSLVLFLSLGSHPSIDLLFGRAYRDAIPLVIGMGWTSMLVVIAENLNVYSLSAGNTRLIAIASIAQKVVFMGGAFLLIPPLHGMGYILAGLLAGILQVGIILTLAWKGLEDLLQRHILILALWSAISIGVIYVCLYFNYSVLNNIIFAIASSLVLFPLAAISILTHTEKTYLLYTLKRYTHRS